MTYGTARAPARRSRVSSVTAGLDHSRAVRIKHIAVGAGACRRSPPSEDLDAREREQEPAEEQRDEGERHAHLRVLDEADLDARRSRRLDDDEVGHGAEDREG